MREAVADLVACLEYDEAPVDNSSEEEEGESGSRSLEQKGKKKKKSSAR